MKKQDGHFRLPSDLQEKITSQYHEYQRRIDQCAANYDAMLQSTLVEVKRIEYGAQDAHVLALLEMEQCIKLFNPNPYSSLSSVDLDYQEGTVVLLVKGLYTSDVRLDKSFLEELDSLDQLTKYHDKLADVDLVEIIRGIIG